jgi:DNA-binding response OmpR family regulator
VSPELVAVVDDDPRIRELLAAEVEDLGAEVLRCGDGRQLLHHPRLAQVQLVLLDWMMPGLDGAGTLGQLRAQDHPGRVVVITALCDPAVQAQALEAGATGTLLKTEALGALPQLLNPG